MFRGAQLTSSIRRVLMIRTPQEGLEKYKLFLKEYKEWKDRVFRDYDPTDHREDRRLIAQQNGMVTVLGLTLDEIIAIEVEVGIRRN